MTSKNKKSGGCGCGGNCGDKKCKKCADAAKNAATTPAAPASTPAAPAATPADAGKKKLDCGCGGKK